jgi:hypothetical protein
MPDGRLKDNLPFSNAAENSRAVKLSVKDAPCSQAVIGNRIRMYAGPVSWVSNYKHWL